MEYLNQIIQMNELITKALKSNSKEEDLKQVFELALRAKDAVALSDYASSTEYDLLVDNIGKLREKLGIPEEKPKTLTPDSDRRLEREKAFTSAMSAPFEVYKQGLQATRDARYQTMIDQYDEPVQGSVIRK